MWNALYASVLHREVGSDEVFYVLGPESQYGPLSAKAHYRDSRVATGRVIANPISGDPQLDGNVIQGQ